MANYTVIFDACVLYPVTMRSLLIQLAMTGLFQAKWTEEIHQEWIRNLLINRPDLKPKNLEKTKVQMIKAIPNSLVTGYESLIPTLQLPDENDRHVLAAAIRCNAQAIITNNLKDFPQDTLSPFDIEAIDPDSFLDAQIGLSDKKVLISAKKCRQRLKNPPFSPLKYIQSLRKAGLIKTAAFLHYYEDFF